MVPYFRHDWQLDSVEKQKNPSRKTRNRIRRRAKPASHTSDNNRTAGKRQADKEIDQEPGSRERGEKKRKKERKKKREKKPQYLSTSPYSLNERGPLKKQKKQKNQSAATSPKETDTWSQLCEGGWGGVGWESHQQSRISVAPS